MLIRHSLDEVANIVFISFDHQETVKDEILVVEGWTGKEVYGTSSCCLGMALFGEF